jgi:hypothetical protein
MSSRLSTNILFIRNSTALHTWGSFTVLTISNIILTHYVTTHTSKYHLSHAVCSVSATHPRYTTLGDSFWISFPASFTFTALSYFFPEGGLGLVPKRGCLLTLAYYATVEWYWQGKTEEVGGKTCPGATLSTTNPTWIDLGTNHYHTVRLQIQICLDHLQTYV